MEVNRIFAFNRKHTYINYRFSSNKDGFFERFSFKSPNTSWFTLIIFINFDIKLVNII